MGIERILEKKLRLDSRRATDEWIPWEHKTWSIHRGVILWRPKGAIQTVSEIISGVRKGIGTTYKMSWWRGFAFGAIITLPAPPNDLETLVEAIDTRNTTKGVWQWVILVTDQPRAALAIHTWTEGYLYPTCQEALGHYEGMGYKVGQFTKQMDSLMKFMAYAAALKGHRF